MCVCVFCFVFVFDGVGGCEGWVDVVVVVVVVVVVAKLVLRSQVL